MGTARLLGVTRFGPDMAVVGRSGRPVRLHSSRDPLGEARRLLAAALHQRPQALVLIGGGLGYALDVLQNDAPQTRILIVEPIPEVAEAARQRHDWTTRERTGRLRVVVGPSYENAPNAWRVLDAEDEYDIDELEVPVVVHPVLARECADEVARARQVADRILFDARANAGARRQFGGLYVRNSLANLARIRGEATVDVLRSGFRGVPAIVVGAGPSLDLNVGALAQFQQDALIVAADTALRPLLGAGIQPHVAVALDPGDLNTAHLENLPPSTTHLVVEPSVAPPALAAFAGRTFSFRVGTHAPWRWLAERGPVPGLLRAWGSVVTAAYDLALEAGCDPILFAGLDLSFPGGQPYCRGTTFEELWAPATAGGTPLADVWRIWIEQRPRVPEVGVDGVLTDSAAHLIAFRDWLVNDTTARHDRRFVNVTTRGILAGPAIEQSTLAAERARLGPARDRQLATRLRAAWSSGAWHPLLPESPGRDRLERVWPLLEAHIRACAPAIDENEIVRLRAALEAAAADSSPGEVVGPGGLAWRTFSRWVEPLWILPDAGDVTPVLRELLLAMPTLPAQLQRTIDFMGGTDDCRERRPVRLARLAFLQGLVR